jgi:hypothetical protein
MELWTDRDLVATGSLSSLVGILQKNCEPKSPQCANRTGIPIPKY